MAKTQGKQPKKVLYLITKSNFGGAQKYVFELAVAAKQAGYAVVVGCGGTGKAGAATGRLVTKLQEVAIPVHSISHFMRDMSFLSDIRAFFEVWRLLRHERPEVLHVTSSKAGGIGALAGRLARVPRIIFTSHGLTVDEVWRPRWQRTLIYLGTWITLALAHQSIMITSETYQRAQKMPRMKDRVVLIKNGVAPIDFLTRTAARASLAPHLPPRALWIGGIGELHPNKNWSAAITALRTLPAQTHLLIIGEGEERPKLEQLITQEQLQERVHLLGYLEAAPHLMAFDIFVLSSQKEGLPYVLLEAGLAGLPIVASDLPGIRDIITTGETGLLVTPTPELLATSLSMLIRDEGMRRQLGQRAQQHITSTFSITHMCTDTFKLYDSKTASD
ncbi:glycosyltransferase [Candidatus Nomurabacteria bacterium]|nr:glycosyltransferase [Candidatus Nomurabacteria bacterium]